MIVVEGTLYPILTRQKNAGLLTYRWEESPQGPPRKYYSLTEKGLQYLRSLDEAWDELVGQIQVIRHGRTDTAGQTAEVPATETSAGQSVGEASEPATDPVPAFENPNM